MRFKRLTLKNFRSFEDTTFYFSDVTSVIGDNAAGKTNFIRALRTVALHESFPERWISWWAPRSTLELEMEDGTIVRRIRTKGKETTQIERAGVIETFDGKRDAKDYVLEATGLSKVVLENPDKPLDLNFVGVHDGLFLVLDPPELLQKRIAAIVGGTEIEEARRRLASKVDAMAKEEKRLTEELTPIEAQVSEDERLLGALDLKLAQATALQATADGSTLLLERLRKIQSSLESLNEPYLDGEKVIDLRVKLLEISTHLTYASKVVERRQRLASLRYPASGPSPESVVQWRGQAEEVKGRLTRLEKSLPRTLRLRAIQTSTSNHGALLLQDESERVQEGWKLSEAGRLVKDLLAQLKVCPVCGQETTDIASS